MFSVALYFLDDLTRENPTSIDYWGYLGNCCLSLGFYDRALAAYRSAESLMKSDDSNQWIISNIGNLFANKGLPTEACLYLERAVAKDPRSEYAHNRMASSLKSKDEQYKEYRKKYSEGFRIVKDTEAKRRQLASAMEGEAAPA
jgi:tetratricopeptide (TPR) repeat protein